MGNEVPGSVTHEGQQKFLARLNRAFLAGVVALAAVGLTFSLLAWLNHRSFDMLIASQTITRLARESKVLTVDRETSIRGFLLSRQTVSLAPELAARGPLKARLDSLILLSRDNVAQHERARAIRSAVVRWERGWAMPILATPDVSGKAQEREMLAGKELFDSIRAAFDTFLTGQQRISATRLRALKTLQAFSFVLIVLEGLVLLGILIWMRSRAVTQAKLLLDQHQRLEAQSLDLQQQAAELEEQAMELEEQADEANRNANALQEANAELEATIRELEQSRETVSLEKNKGEVTTSLLNVLIEKAPVGVILWNSQHKVVRVNPALEAMTGYNGPDNVGRSLDELASEEIADTVEAILDEVLETGKTVMNVPLTGTNRIDPTHERHFLGSYFPVMLPGNERGVGGVVLETTQFRQLEEQLLQSQKMEAVGRLAGGVAHDFNNMLTAIMSYSELILSDMPADSQMRTDMVEIVKAAEKATALTRKLLAFSRQQVLRPTMVDLNETIDSSRKVIKRLLGSEIELSLNLARNLWTVSADPTEVDRVLMNLVLNSRDAMPEGGKLIIETTNFHVDDEYARTHAETKAGDYVMVAITDSGAGMTKETRDKIFEPFFTTKEKGKGTGLGLASVYGIVKQSGGFMWVYSELGKGTTFKIYLPRAQAPQRATPTTPHKNRVIGAETILLVEDDAEVRQVASRILRRNGYRVIEAGNGADALKAADNEAEPVDLIVTDIVMPEMGGTELAKRIREKQPDARILFTSGYTEDAVVRQSLLHEGESFIEKPFTPATLAKKAREMLNVDEDEVT
jgi:PAS domain S-box-containing protein